jgi:hypothetical protein
MPGSTERPAIAMKATYTIEETLGRRLLVAYGLLLVAIASIAIVGVQTGTGIGSALTVVEIVILAFTLLILVLLSKFTADSFSRDAQEITSTFERTSNALIERSQEHWEAQSQALTNAINALQAVVELEREALRVTQDTLRVSTTLLELERQRESIRAEEARLRKQRIRPIPAFLPVITHPGPVAKRIAIRLFNQGEDGRRVSVVLRWGANPNQSMSGVSPDLGAYSNREFDFADIDAWSDSEDFSVVVELADVDGTRYRSSGEFSYSRNRGLILSAPSFNPSEWQYPASRELT